MRWRRLGGGFLAGQGLLVLTGILDHEAPPLVGAALIAVGAALLATGPAAGEAKVAPLRRAFVAGAGAALVVAVAGYNVAVGSGLAAPEVALLAYGLALLAAAPHLGRAVGGLPVERAVAWSFPLLLAPLGLWALQALFAAGAAPSPLLWYVRTLILPPLSAALAFTGSEARLLGDTVALATPRGTLFLTVGAVCAGLYAMVLFLGVLALHAWESGVGAWRLAALLAAGLGGLHLANLLRLLVVARVGEAWGAGALRAAHEHAGWVIFLLFSLAFWFVALRPPTAPAPAGGR